MTQQRHRATNAFLSRIAFVLVMVVAYAARADAQDAEHQLAGDGNMGRISGVLLDTGGQPAPGGRLELSWQDAGSLRLVAVADSEGRFAYTNLHDGKYKVRLVEAGVAVASSLDIVLTDDQTVVDDVVIRRRFRPVGRPLSARAILGGGPVPADLTELAQAVAPGGRGYEVVVTTDDGRKVAGRIAGVDAGQITLSKRRLFGRPDRTFPADSVQRIEVIDSTVNGVLIGVAGMAAGFLAVPALCSSVSCLFYSSMSVAVLPVVGALVDEQINQPIFQKPVSSDVLLKVGRASGRTGAGVAASLGWRF